MKSEIKIIMLRVKNDNDLQEEINKICNEGWEFVTLLTENFQDYWGKYSYQCFFKRIIDD